MLHRQEGALRETEGGPAGRTRQEPGTDWNGTAYDRRWEAYTEATLAPVLACLGEAPLPPDVRILDIGCGTGVLLERVARRHAGARLTGLDPSSRMLAAAARRLRERGEGELDRFQGTPDPVQGSHGLVQASSEAIPLAPGSFDVVVSSSSLHFWADPGAGLREIARVLGPGGRLVLMDWSGDRLHMRLLDHWLRFRDPRHQRVLGTRELQILLADAGFQVPVIRQLRSHGLWSHFLLDAVVADRQGEASLL